MIPAIDTGELSLLIWNGKRFMVLRVVCVAAY